MQSSCLGFMPLLLDGRGDYLTSANWLQTGVRTVSCSLEALLYKPGWSFLHQLPDLATYLGWPQTLVLNACLESHKGEYKFRSPFDGQTFSLSSLDLLTVIKHLKPHYVLLPKDIDKMISSDFWQDWPVSICPLFSVYCEEAPALAHSKKYVDLSDTMLNEACDLTNFLVRGQLDNKQIKKLQVQGVFGIESNQPILDACQGILYTGQGTIDIKDKACALQFHELEKDCPCETCKQSFTKAYLHHLVNNTPLLAERLLIMHNATLCNN